MRTFQGRQALRSFGSCESKELQGCVLFLMLVMFNFFFPFLSTNFLAFQGPLFFPLSLS